MISTFSARRILFTKPLEAGYVVAIRISGSIAWRLGEMAAR